MGLEFKSGFSWELLSPFAGGRHWLPRLRPRLYGSGRAALYELTTMLMHQNGSRSVLLPDYQCNEVYETLSKIEGLKLVPYPIGSDLLPVADTLKSLAANEHEPIIVLVDYFSSTAGDKLLDLARSLSGFIIFDLVHSFPVKAFPLDAIKANWALIFGYRKLFWKGLGAVVAGPTTKELKRWPGIIAAASSNFPRSLSLTLRYGTFLEWFLLRLIDWTTHVASANSWSARPIKAEGLIAQFNSPVRLRRLTTQPLPGEVALEPWPDLSPSLSPILRANAERLKSGHVVSRK